MFGDFEENFDFDLDFDGIQPFNKSDCENFVKYAAEK